MHLDSRQEEATELIEVEAPCRGGWKMRSTNTIRLNFLGPALALLLANLPNVAYPDSDVRLPWTWLIRSILHPVAQQYKGLNN